MTKEEAERAMLELGKTDELEARLYVDAEMLKAKHEAIVDSVYLLGEGTVAERSARARTSDHAKQAMADYLEAVFKHRTLKNQRSTWEKQWEGWRTESSNKRQGVLT